MLNLDSNIQFIKGVGEKEPSCLTVLASLTLTALFIFTQENMRIGLSAKP